MSLLSIFKGLSGFKGLMGLIMGLMVLTAAARTPTRVEITAQPDGARIVVDGEVRGTAPLQLFDLTPGRHLFHDLPIAVILLFFIRNSQ